MADAKRGFNFDMIEVKKPNYSKFNLSHDHLCALGSGKLVPIWWTESVPGDLWQVNISSFVRLLALSSPMLQREDIFIRAFKVPERILADRKDQDLAWTGGKTGEHINFPMCYPAVANLKVGSLNDYLGLPLAYKWNNSTKSWDFNYGDIENSLHVSIFPFLAYQRIYHDHFRNEETEDDFLELFDQKYSDLDGHDFTETVEDSFGISGAEFYLDDLRNVCWERDYLTSALSRPQRGSQVSIPLVGTANVVGTTTPPTFSTLPGGVGEENVVIGPNGNIYRDSEAGDPLLWTNTGLVVDGSSFTGIGAVALRMAMNLQAFLERNNVAGYRMIGQILAHFGVHSSNKQFDEAEYLGGIKAPITISAVNQTSASAAGSTPQGNQVGTAQSSFSGHLFSTYVEEPAILMVVAYINAKSSYSQGLARKWTRRTYLDRYWPEFQTIGEQEILNQEVWFDFYSANDKNADTWAYQSRYSEFKYEPDTIAGDFRTTLSYWHQSRLFTSMPAFNDDFVKSDPSGRVFAVDTAIYPRPYLGEFYFDIQTVRPMSKYAQSKLW